MYAIFAYPQNFYAKKSQSYPNPANTEPHAGYSCGAAKQAARIFVLAACRLSGHGSRVFKRGDARIRRDAARRVIAMGGYVACFTRHAASLQAEVGCDSASRYISYIRICGRDPYRGRFAQASRPAFGG